MVIVVHNCFQFQPNSIRANDIRPNGIRLNGAQINGIRLHDPEPLFCGTPNYATALMMIMMTDISHIHVKRLHQCTAHVI